MRASWMVVAACVLLASCAGSQRTFSEVTGARFNMAPAFRQPVVIVSVGGQTGWASGRMMVVDPGLQRVVVNSMPRGGFTGRTAEFELNIEPCTRYWINAQFPDNISLEFVPVIDHQERIPGCAMPAAKS